MKDISAGGITGISHIAIQVKDLEEAIRQYELLGFRQDPGEIIVEEQFGVRAKVIRQGDTVIELMSPTDDDSPLARQMAENRRYALDHICYETEDIDAEVERLKKEKFMVTQKKRISGVWGRSVVLMGNRKMGVIELIEGCEK